MSATCRYRVSLKAHYVARRPPGDFNRHRLAKRQTRLVGKTGSVEFNLLADKLYLTSSYAIICKKTIKKEAYANIHIPQKRKLMRERNLSQIISHKKSKNYNINNSVQLYYNVNNSVKL